MTRLIARRLALLPLQVVGVTLVTFFLVRLLPGNPAQLIAGPYATPATVALTEKRLGLSGPIWSQYWIYVKDVVHLNLGVSFYTGHSILSDIEQRLPATLELITFALVIIVLVGMSLGTMVALRKGGVVDKLSFLYGLLAGALPDFWIGLILVYFLFFKLGWFPAPEGRLAADLTPPPRVTGFMTIDSLFAGNLTDFGSAVAHLALPVFTLVLAYMGPVLKMTRARLRDMLDSDFVEFGRASGLSDRALLRYAFRNALPPVITITGVTYSFLLGGAVLVEQIFSWGGLGQYAVQVLQASDYLAIQGVILVCAAFNLLVYLIVDIIDAVIDPRINVTD